MKEIIKIIVKWILFSLVIPFVIFMIWILINIFWVTYIDNYLDWRCVDYVYENYECSFKDNINCNWHNSLLYNCWKLENFFNKIYIRLSISYWLIFFSIAFVIYLIINLKKITKLVYSVFKSERNKLNN